MLPRALRSNVCADFNVNSNRMSFFILALFVTAANFAMGFGLAVYLGHGPELSLYELRALLTRRRPAVASPAVHASNESKKSGH